MLEGKKQPPSVAPSGPKAVFRTCDLFRQSLADKILGEPRVLPKFEEFIKTKTLDPMKTFGSNDRPFIRDGFLKDAVPGETLLHAHLDRDNSVVYSLSGRNPTVIKLYGVLNHADLGTGNPANIKKQRSIAVQFSNQKFDSEL